MLPSAYVVFTLSFVNSNLIFSGFCGDFILQCFAADDDNSSSFQHWYGGWSSGICKETTGISPNSVEFKYKNNVRIDNSYMVHKDKSKKWYFVALICDRYYEYNIGENL